VLRVRLQDWKEEEIGKKCLFLLLLINLWVFDWKEEKTRVPPAGKFFLLLREVVVR